MDRQAFWYRSCADWKGFQISWLHPQTIWEQAGDWSWLLDWFYSKISEWEARVLSLAGPYILVHAVLSQLVIYWAHLFFIPAPIINKMKSYAANFPWGGKSCQTKILLVKMKSLTIPKKLGRWGLLDMRLMGNALLCKTLLHRIYGNGPWSIFIKRKYLKGKNIAFWYRRNSMGIKKGSAIWQSLRKNLPFIMKNFRFRNKYFYRHWSHSQRIVLPSAAVIGYLFPLQRYFYMGPSHQIMVILVPHLDGRRWSHIAALSLLRMESSAPHLTRFSH